MVQTGTVWHGWRVPTADEDRRRLEQVVDGVIAARADVALVMRPAALRGDQLRRLCAAGVRTVAWFADDPVFFAVQSTKLAPLYDLTLHTAMGPVLARYEHELGVRGVGFPFWAGPQHFPRLYDPARCDVDVVFIGNVHNEVKAWRYDWLAGLPVSKVMYGQAKDDPAGIVAGVAQDDEALARACARGRFGLNISQRFADYAGSRFDFPGLAELGEFPLPSRVVQLAAVGVPVLALVGSDRAAEDLELLVPPAVVVRDEAEATSAVQRYAADPDALAELSARTHAWYLSHYTAAARARFLHELLTRPEQVTALDADARAVAFLDHPTPTDAWVERTAAEVRAQDRRRALVRPARQAVLAGRRLIARARRRLGPPSP